MTRWVYKKTEILLNLLSNIASLQVMEKLVPWLILLVQIYGQRQTPHSYTYPQFLNSWYKKGRNKQTTGVLCRVQRKAQKVE